MLSDLSRSLENENLLDMFASTDRKKFAEDLVRTPVERLARSRCRILLPSLGEFVQGIGRVVNDACSGTGIFSDSKNTDAMEIGRKLTGRELSEHVAKKAWYMTKQMDMAQRQTEVLLGRMAADEEKTKQTLDRIHRERDRLKSELDTLLGGK